GPGRTRVGTDRRISAVGGQTQSEPHARGDGPGPGTGQPPRGRQVPRTWGWTVQSITNDGAVTAGPTHVGMDRTRPGRWRPRRSRPHARGDGPPGVIAWRSPDPQAPRTWGWTFGRPQSDRGAVAGPTHVGMDRSSA